MIMGKRIVVSNHEYARVSAFASSFDYSTERWNAFYKYKETLLSVAAAALSHV